MREEYSASIVESSIELTKKEKILFKDLSDAYALDQIITDQDDRTIGVKGYVVVEVHNEKSDNKDYTKYVIIDDNGNKYVTGSDAFFASFKDIWDEMVGEDGQPEEDFEIRIYNELQNDKKRSRMDPSVRNVLYAASRYHGDRVR